MGYKKRYSNFNLPDMKAVNSTQALNNLYSSELSEKPDYSTVEQRMSNAKMGTQVPFKPEEIKVPIEKRSGGLDVERITESQKESEKPVEATTPVKKGRASNSLLYIGVIAIGIVGLMLLRNK